MQCDRSVNLSTSGFQPPQEQPGVTPLRTQSDDIFTQLCSLPSMTMSADVLAGGEEGRACVCQGFETEAKGSMLRGPRLLTLMAASFPAVVSPNSYSLALQCINTKTHG